MSLFKRLQNKTKTTDVALRKRIQREANNEGVSTQEALLVLASVEGIGIQNELRKLGTEDKNKVQLAISHHKSSAKDSQSSVPSSIPKLGIRKILVDEDPFLGSRLTKETNEMAGKGYLLLYFF